MIAPNVEQRLGRHTWMLLLSKKTTTSVALLLVAVILGSAKDFIGQGISGLVGGAGNAIASFTSMAAVGILIIAMIMFLVGYIIARLEYRNYTFTVEEFDLKIRRGIFSIKEVSIPYRQIQNVDVIQSFVYRMFHVCSLVLTTAGVEDNKAGADSDMLFDPIDVDIAEEIRLMLQKRIGVQVVTNDNANNVTSNTVYQPKV